MTGGVYIHVPFCRRKCDYCNFYSVPLGHIPGDAVIPANYIRRLTDEIRRRLPAAGFSSADTVYFGGGTPSLLTAGQVKELLDGVRQNVALAPAAEITLEMNPGGVSADALDSFRDAGVTRVVLGVQTLSERLHRLIGRSALPCTARDLEVFFSVPGIAQCADIITGIPTQTAGELARDIDLVAAYRPRHISAYVLSIEKNTPLSRRMVPDEAAEAGQARLFGLTMELLSKHGYGHYEISNYALPGFESRHNMKYWRFEPYLGLGPGAHSFVGGERYINAMTVEEYLAADRAVLVHDARSPESAAVEYLMTGLRLLKGISLDEMEERLSFPLPPAVMERIGKAVSDGLAAVDTDARRTVRLTARGIMVADRVIYGILEPLL
ncbi:MAG TPA: radical SAM family heme chaperone HemW [Spirochaetota bacterium]|nr:radical SAM family heme chaperone HemW [Spirochaetota bacterium]HPC40826.1 radical SAM family heme chaperone HemW [Spirochaetota bacterium]HPL18371.1 radical SAM family heme chaperone HemW [Spirochaetota bacterium]HQF07784.1 radical SAM family heme chaperone HemW [Spirochaetota bacterium]HQH96837.1 radical SAM family heme chaperone HemW [Spirochaetota bacterium]